MTVFIRVFAVLAALRGVETLVEYPAAGVIWLAAAALLFRYRWAGYLLAAAAGFSALFLIPVNSAVFVVWVALAIAVFDDAHLREALKWLAVIIYGYAALNKMAGGNVVAHIESYVTWLPAQFVRPVAAAAIASQAILAWAIARRWDRTLILAVAVGFHVATSFGIGDGWMSAAMITVFNASVLWIVWWSTQAVEPSPRADNEVRTHIRGEAYSFDRVSRV